MIHLFIILIILFLDVKFKCLIIRYVNNCLVGNSYFGTLDEYTCSNMEIQPANLNSYILSYLVLCPFLLLFKVASMPLFFA